MWCQWTCSLRSRGTRSSSKITRKRDPKELQRWRFPLKKFSEFSETILLVSPKVLPSPVHTDLVFQVNPVPKRTPWKSPRGTYNRFTMHIHHYTQRDPFSHFGSRSQSFTRKQSVLQCQFLASVEICRPDTDETKGNKRIMDRIHGPWIIHQLFITNLLVDWFF